MAKNQVDSTMEHCFGTAPKPGSPGTYDRAKPPFDQPGDGRVFQQKIYDTIKDGAPSTTIDSTMDHLGRMGTVGKTGAAYPSDDDADD